MLRCGEVKKKIYYGKPLEQKCFGGFSVLGKQRKRKAETLKI